ncbi:DUF3152 domain-containing protein [Aquihabitans sp. G128]|uniref:DUF3152 domain-containing protein n=1 Tax=Aquihabitans sp. G128 TaxID=2849779 RepID=UPI001C217F01|nr:DUF3152 domain-containing protein [Aquihabitans sp. G128]QXC62944.1 DUF3152 domain-containing protein [Aquihabitans sp. G128]
MPGPQPPAVYRRRRLAVVAASVLVLAVLVAAAARWSDHGDGDGTASRSPSTTTATEATTTTRAAATTSTTRPTGRFDRASGGTPVVGTGTLYRYAVEVEEGTGVDVDDFARAVDATLDDRRGWTTADGISLQRVSDATAQFTVRLATPATTDLLCAPLTTEGQVSCGHNDSAVINLTRWLDGAAPSKLSVADYRHYVVTHEFGHLIGHRHETCPGPGQRATTMMQQSYDIGACTPNPWPAPDA